MLTGEETARLTSSPIPAVEFNKIRESYYAKALTRQGGAEGFKNARFVEMEVFTKAVEIFKDGIFSLGAIDTNRLVSLQEIFLQESESRKQGLQRDESVVGNDDLPCKSDVIAREDDLVMDYEDEMDTRRVYSLDPLLAVARIEEALERRELIRQ